MKKLNIGILVALFGVAAVVWGSQLSHWLRPVPNLSRYPLGPWFYCENCSWHFDESPRLVAPLKCPKCKQLAGMRTTYGPGATLPEFVQCKTCQIKLPYQLYKWPPAEKARWEKRLSGLDDGQLMTAEEMHEMQSTRLMKTLARPDWLTLEAYSKLPPSELNAVRCSKCNNNDPAQFNYGVPPPNR